MILIDFFCVVFFFAYGIHHPWFPFKSQPIRITNLHTVMMPTEDISKGVGGNHQDNETTNMQCKKEATQDLILATMDPNVEEAQDGIARGADVNHKNEVRMSFCSTSFGYCCCFDSVCLHVQHGMSPLIIACGGIGPRQMLHELLRAGADVNLCDNVRANLPV